MWHVVLATIFLLISAVLLVMFIVLVKPLLLILSLTVMGLSASEVWAAHKAAVEMSHEI